MPIQFELSDEWEEQKRGNIPPCGTEGREAFSYLAHQPYDFRANLFVKIEDILIKADEYLNKEKDLPPVEALYNAIVDVEAAQSEGNSRTQYQQNTSTLVSPDVKNGNDYETIFNKTLSLAVRRYWDCGSDPCVTRYLDTIYEPPDTSFSPGIYYVTIKLPGQGKNPRLN